MNEHTEGRDWACRMQITSLGVRSLRLVASCLDSRHMAARGIAKSSFNAYSIALRNSVLTCHSVVINGLTVEDIQCTRRIKRK
jgi:hypothetical protein